MVPTARALCYNGLMELIIVFIALLITAQVTFIGVSAVRRREQRRQRLGRVLEAFATLSGLPYTIKATDDGWPTLSGQQLTIQTCQATKQRLLKISLEAPFPSHLQLIVTAQQPLYANEPFLNECFTIRSTPPDLMTQMTAARPLLPFKLIHALQQIFAHAPLYVCTFTCEHGRLTLSHSNIASGVTELQTAVNLLHHLADALAATEPALAPTDQP